MNDDDERLKLAKAALLGSSGDLALEIVINGSGQSIDPGTTTGEVREDPALLDKVAALLVAKADIANTYNADHLAQRIMDCERPSPSRKFIPETRLPDPAIKDWKVKGPNKGWNDPKAESQNKPEEKPRKKPAPSKYNQRRQDSKDSRNRAEYRTVLQQAAGLSATFRRLYDVAVAELDSRGRLPTSKRLARLLGLKGGAAGRRARRLFLTAYELGVLMLRLLKPGATVKLTAEEVALLRGQASKPIDWKADIGLDVREALAAGLEELAQHPDRPRPVIIQTDKGPVAVAPPTGWEQAVFAQPMGQGWLDGLAGLGFDREQTARELSQAAVRAGEYASQRSDVLETVLAARLVDIIKSARPGRLPAGAWPVIAAVVVTVIDRPPRRKTDRSIDLSEVDIEEAMRRIGRRLQDRVKVWRKHQS